MKKGERKSAEPRGEEAASGSACNPDALCPEETQGTLHELRVHQIELELQNEELRQAQVDLDASRQRYSDLYDLAPVGYLTVGESGLILEANLTAATLLGVTRDALVTLPLSTFIHKESQDTYYLHCKQLFETGAPQSLELRMAKNDGTLFWAHLETSGAHDRAASPGLSGGSLPVLHIALSNITEHKQLEDTRAFLLQCGHPVSGEGFFEALARHLAQVLGMGYVCVDRLESDGLSARTLAIFNDGVFETNVTYALKDTPCGDVVGKTICCFPRDVSALFPRDAALLDLKAESYIGTTLWSHDGQPIGLIAVIGRTPLANRSLAESIMKLVAIRAAAELERQQAEVALRQNEHLLRQSQSVARIGHYVLAVAEGTWSSSETLDEIFGIGPEHPRTVAGWIGLVHPDEREQMRGYFEDTVLHERQRFDRDYRIVRPADGAVHWVHGTGGLEFAADGRPLRMFGVIQDVTENKQLAEKAARLEDQLRQAQKMEAIGQLAGGVAHDFNNITAIVLGYAEMLLGKLAAENPLREYVAQIEAAGRRSATLTRQLLAFGRRQTLLPEVLDLNALIRNFDKMLGRLIGEDIQLELRLAADLGRVTADAGQLEQVVTNLAVNARDAMPTGGRLTVETADVELDQLFTQSRESVVPGRYVLLAVTDTGCGMDQAALARLFEPFYTTKGKGKGTGLGLATAYGIVKQSGGYIWASSEPGVGTTFKIYLPRTDAQPLARNAEAAGEALRGNGEQILLVEDEAPLRQLCETILTGLGYRVSAAASGPDALRLALERGFAPALVLTDVIMPGMSGAAMVDQLRLARPDLNVLYMSGYPDDAIAPHGVLDPGTHFIQKPFTARAIAVKIRETLEPGTLAARSPARPTAARGEAAAIDTRVLMIDDDEQYRELVRHFCTRSGHVFAGVDSAAAALAALAGSAFEVLLVDLNIPGTSGERVLREIRAAGHTAPAIVLTGDVASADMGLLRPLGAAKVLEKSSEAEPLLQAIATTRAKRRAAGRP